MATSPYYYYLDVLSQWPTAIAPESQWFLWFDLKSVGALTQNVSNILQKFEPTSRWGINNSTVLNLISDQNQLQTDNLIGCVFARQITVPGDSVVAGNDGLDYGGYQAPATSGPRNKYNKVSIVFTETNSSFIDFVIRPWLISVGYYGLIARNKNSNKNVKCSSLNACYLAKTGPFNGSVIRKQMQFNNIVPVSINGLSNTYASEGLQYGSVDFVYDSYSIIDPI